MNGTTATIAALRRGLTLPALALVAAVLLAPAGNAEAHGVDRVHAAGHAHGQRRYGHDHYYRPYRDYRLRVWLPRWLRHDVGFRRWYGLNYYRYARHVSWHRLHRHYLADRRYHRNLRRGHRHAYRDGGRHRHDGPRRHGRGR